MNRCLKAIGFFMVQTYQSFFSVFLGGNCRYYPSCSEYSKQAFQNLSWHRALWLSLKRVGHCHPLGGEGYDPVPEVKEVR